MATISETLKSATTQLQSSSDSAHLDVELLLSFILEKDRSFLHTWPEQMLSAEQQEKFNALFSQRLHGHPIAHLLGEQGFWSLNLKVTPDTLIPRPETECLVEIALETIPKHQPCHLLDLGTGSGAIALAIATERPLCKITATDISASALAVAEENARTHQIKNIHFIQSSWFENIPPQQFDMIVSNPPYIREKDEHLSEGDVRFDPISALTSGEDGLDDIRTIIQLAPAFLRANAMMLIEHGYDQAQAVQQIYAESNFTNIQNFTDYASHARVTVALR